jgi:hypothetical protein
MTTERKRALLMIGSTLIIGILIGALAVGFWSNQTHRAGKRNTGSRKDGREIFMKKILSVVEADSAQAKLIRPYVNETMAKIDSIQVKTNREIFHLADSFELKLEPILTEEQMKKLKEFHKRVRNDKELK